MNTKQKFEARIVAQEKLVHENAFKFDDETQEEFDAKIARRIKMVCLGYGNAREIPEIESICPGLDAIWEGFLVQRRRVDQLDNIYISRAQ